MADLFFGGTVTEDDSDVISQKPFFHCPTLSAVVWFLPVDI